MKMSRVILILCGLLPGVGIGWMMSESNTSAVNERAGNNEDGITASRSARVSGANSKLNRVTDRRGGLQASSVNPLLDLMGGDVDMADDTGMLIMYRLFKEIGKLRASDYPEVMEPIV